MPKFVLGNISKLIIQTIGNKSTADGMRIYDELSNQKNVEESPHKLITSNFKFDKSAIQNIILKISKF